MLPHVYDTGQLILSYKGSLYMKREERYAPGRQQQSQEASAMAAQRTKTYCSDCEKFFFFDCFNEEHHSM